MSNQTVPSKYFILLKHFKNYSTSFKSFDSLSKWVTECANHGITPDDVPMIMVGNKCESDNEQKMAVGTYKAQR